jgi:hypothetical protein
MVAQIAGFLLRGHGGGDPLLRHPPLQGAICNSEQAREPMASTGAGVVCGYCPLAKSEVIWFSYDAIKVPTHLLHQFKCPYGINP